ncbi:MAG: class I SAM-dependent methyltransferase [Methanosphaera stadtmanae]|nr:class I SAM-dependent methyltransferase [Methanosphaera stadtmanae]
MMPDLKKHFNKEAEAFDKQVQKNIPCYNEMLTALINAIPNNKDSPKILDLGCGTGNITQKALNRFPEAEVTCLDLSENMIEIAKDKLSSYENIEYIVGDFTQMELNTKYDVVLSSLALHHIPNDEEKEAMYKNIYETLEKDGVFYNADVIKANSNYNEELNNKVAIQEMKENGVTDEEIAEHKGKRDANDIPTTLIKHIKMLENVGFKEIDVIWKHYSNAVYGGSKK